MNIYSSKRSAESDKNEREEAIEYNFRQNTIFLSSVGVVFSDRFSHRRSVLVDINVLRSPAPRQCQPLGNTWDDNRQD